MRQAESRRFLGLTPLQLGIIVLVVITALVHLQRGIGVFGSGGGGGQGGPPCPP